ncbi:MAG: S1 domain-containing protein [Peptostreptococcaceae bacterium]
MKGKVLDYTDFEAFVALEDDSIIRVPITEVSNFTSIGSIVNLSSHSGSFGSCNNHQTVICQDKLMDFF